MNTVQPKIGQVDPDKISIRNIKITNAQVNSLLDEPVNDQDDVKIQLNTTTMFNQENESRIIFQINITKRKESGEEIANATFTIQFDFHVENLDEFLSYPDGPEKDSLTADASIGSTLMGIAYSTSRGIILTRSNGTPLQGVILPVIDPRNLLTTEIDE
ncbi:hypothetical protein [Pedobacter hartonius]|uniref:Preprotein translocase subunit SecB n=1 Tax=Pedobacter hartonius TaxID=425514 RepID=A0A1H4H5P6_9SPHI|nr:hypothetical protein [Pedobacter hartonius]SEB17056.1 hypothetical protein SAMN05443550_113135 [Pedobacter hartonius]